MHLSIEHHATFAPARSVRPIAQLLRLTPDDHDDQNIATWSLHVDCDSTVRHGRDGFGNRTTMLYLAAPGAQITLSAVGEVLTHDAAGMVRNTLEPLPPALFRRATPLTPACPKIAAFAHETAEARKSIARLHALNDALHRRCGPTGAMGAAARAADIAWDDPSDAGDVAHLLCVAARAIGMPARYVSGFKVDEDGEVELHAWVEAHVEELGWASFDPTTGCSTDARYVRLAVALDRAGATPIAGPGLGTVVEVGEQ